MTDPIERAVKDYEREFSQLVDDLEAAGATIVAGSVGVILLVDGHVVARQDYTGDPLEALETLAAMWWGPGPTAWS